MEIKEGLVKLRNGMVVDIERKTPDVLGYAWIMKGHGISSEWIWMNDGRFEIKEGKHNPHDIVECYGQPAEYPEIPPQSQEVAVGPYVSTTSRIEGLWPTIDVHQGVIIPKE